MSCSSVGSTHGPVPSAVMRIPSSLMVVTVARVTETGLVETPSVTISMLRWRVGSENCCM